MDLSIDVEDYVLYVRAACIIIHNNKILLHRDIRTDYYAIIGGKVSIGESTEETIKREILEETGKEIEITGYVSTIENFYKNEEKKYHEYMFVYKAEFKNVDDRKILDNIENFEGKKYEHYEWININDVNEFNIKPKVMKEILKENKYPAHKINIDI